MAAQGAPASAGTAAGLGRWRAWFASGYLSIFLLALLLGMGGWHLLDRVTGYPVALLSGRVLDAPTDGFLTVRCRTGEAQASLSARAQGQFRLDMGPATAPCLLEWRATDGQRLFAIAPALERTQPVEVSALTHIWVHFLRHVPLLRADSAETVPDWFLQGPVQALLQDASTQQRLAQDHFLPALYCLGRAHGERLPASAGSAALLESLQVQGLLGPGRHYTSTAMAIAVLAGLGTEQASPPPCHWLLQAAQQPAALNDPIMPSKPVPS